MKDERTNEEFYNVEIAPALLELGQKCVDRRMSFVAVIEYKPNEPGTTAWLGENAGLAMVMAQHCAMMGTNLDGYVMGILRYAKENGIDFSGSIVARQMGWSKK